MGQMISPQDIDQNHSLPGEKPDGKLQSVIVTFRCYNTRDIVNKNKKKLIVTERITHVKMVGHTSEVRIYFWHLLMNSKNNYLLKNRLKWANKNCKNFDIYNIIFFLKNEKHLEILLFKPVYQKSWYLHSWDVECDGLKLVILGHFLHL